MRSISLKDRCPHVRRTQGLEVKSCPVDYKIGMLTCTQRHGQNITVSLRRLVESYNDADMKAFFTDVLWRSLTLCSLAVFSVHTCSSSLSCSFSLINMSLLLLLLEAAGTPLLAA